MNAVMEEPPVVETDDGELDILNTGAGHLKFSFKKEDVKEREQAKRAIEDMLMRGYSIFVELKDGTLKRVKRFDPKKCEYVVQESKTMTKRVPMGRAKATAVGRSAGG